MAYTPFSPYQTPYQSGFAGYQGFSQYYPQLQQPQQTGGSIQPGQQQIRSGGFVSVASLEEAYNWPVAPGDSVTFKIENSPYICTKTKGFSQLEQPVFEKYRLVKEEAQDSSTSGSNRPRIDQNASSVDLSAYALKSDYEGLLADLDGMRKELEQLQVKVSDLAGRKTAKSRKDEVGE